VGAGRHVRVADGDVVEIVARRRSLVEIDKATQREISVGKNTEDRTFVRNCFDTGIGKQTDQPAKLGGEHCVAC